MVKNRHLVVWTAEPLYLYILPNLPFFIYCKTRLLADQINLYFIQLFVLIWQFSGTY